MHSINSVQFAEGAEALASVSLSGPHETQRAYRAALRYWAAWFVLRYGQRITLPVNVDVVLEFLRDHLQEDPDLPPAAANPYRGPRTSSQHRLPQDIDVELVRRGYKKRTGALPLPTVTARLSALSRAHKMLATSSDRRLPSNPTQDLRVREQLRRCRAAAARVARSTRSPTPVDLGKLDALVSTCGQDLAGIRDRALLLLAWHTGGRRRSELAAAQIPQFQLRDGLAYFEMPSPSSWPRRHLPDPRGLTNLKPLPEDAAEAMRAWLSRLTHQDITHGALFRAVRGGHVGEPLTGEAIRMILKRRARAANLDAQQIAPSSLRSGFVREAIADGRPLQDIMALAGYRNVPRRLPL